MLTITEFDHHGVPVRIILDEDPSPSSPRDWSNLSIIAAWHRRSNLGDEGFNLRMDEFESAKEVGEYLVREHGAKHLTPLYLYEHSGQTIRASKGGNPFGDPWDSGQVGFVFTTDERIAEIGTPEDRIEECLLQEVQTYDAFLRGDVYGFIVAEDSDEEESCWGFVGEQDYCESQAREMAEHVAELRERERSEAAYWAARDVATVA